MQRWILRPLRDPSSLIVLGSELPGIWGIFFQILVSLIVIVTTDLLEEQQYYKSLHSPKLFFLPTNLVIIAKPKFEGNPPT